MTTQALTAVGAAVLPKLLEKPATQIIESPIFTERPVNARTARIMADAAARRDFLKLLERILMNPLYGVIVAVTLIDNLSHAGMIDGPSAVALKVAVLAPTFLNTIGQAAGVGDDIIRIISNSSAK